MAGLIRLLRAKWTPPAEPRTSLAGQTIIITGSNTGLGLEAAVKVAALGAATVILAVRDAAKGERAKRMVERRARAAAGVVEVWQLDLGSFASVLGFAERARQLARLDAAVLNAAVSTRRFRPSPHGWEETLQVNVLATALLALLLLPVLRRASTAGTPDAPAVLQIVSSGLYEGVALDADAGHEPMLAILDSCNRPKGFNGRRQYARSKLLVMFAMRSIAALAADAPEGRDVVVLASSPGFCKSELGREHNGLAARVFKAIFYALFARSAEQGARTLVSGTMMGREAHGGLWAHDRLQRLAPMLISEQGEALRQQVWHEILDALRKDVPEVLELSRNG